MIEVKERLHLARVPEPYEYFDLICGSGFGGILALLLGRLHMSIGHCKDWLSDIIKQLYKPSDCSNALLRASDLDIGCKTFVIALPSHSPTTPTRFRSYTSRSDAQIQDCTIVEAAQATAAYPTEFSSIRPKDSDIDYVASALGLANPAFEALDEATRIWQRRAIKSLVSIGAGKAKNLPFEAAPEISSNPFSGLMPWIDISFFLSFSAASSQLLQQAEQSHIQLSRVAKILDLEYFRFNTDFGPTDILHGDYKMADHIQKVTQDYLLKEDINIAKYQCLTKESTSQAVKHQLPDIVKDLDPVLFDTERLKAYHEQLGAAESANDWFELLNERVQVPVSNGRREDDVKVKLAILDSGIDAIYANSLNMKDKMRDWTGSPDGAHDTHGHGTHIAKLIIRVAPNIEIYVGKVFQKAKGDERTAERAIDYCREKWEVNIISMSFGLLERDDQISAAIGRAYAVGILMFAAASNHSPMEGRHSIFPANIKGQVFKICSCDGHGIPSTFTPLPTSNDDNFMIIGESVGPASKGKNSSDTLERRSGTSMATAIAAGIVALLLEYAGQEHRKIKNKSRLWHYAGMRAMLNKMTPSDSYQKANGHQWLIPWELFKPGKAKDHIDYDISWALREEGYI
ncbi:uncharacterized protein KY384_004773 [Bacidia gigantensis]|uniref:uncharacterized protein n=1 Tax=Bacidia gigantensis TaxID=2732470 RepID=UPI001D053F1A|nr:uncharacterized protein KY384_004773 [Bacidia gigantensis]KAG8530272.1 hypothetical protein KY384_004773 [Bacidia gigantensis]